MALLSLQDVHLRLGETKVLDGVHLQIEPGERICLIGRNGAGKTTLMRLLTGEMEAERGEIISAPTLHVARLDQQVPQDLKGPVWDAVAAGAGAMAEHLARYHHLTEQLAHDTSEKTLHALDDARHALDDGDGWRLAQRVDELCSRMELDPAAEASSLSAGLKRRVLLGQALVSDPDLLMLDEPTNHLDIDSIRWLEDFLLRSNKTLLFVTHDRALLRRLATRIIELDRGRLLSWNCNYEKYLERKAESLEAEEKQNALFDKKLAQEEAWIRKGIKARRTRNEGRVRALKDLRNQRAARRDQVGQVRLEVDEGERSGRQVIVAEKASFAYGDRPIVSDLSARIMRGDRVGIIGPNGAGKTTLLRLLLKELAPQHGTVKHGTQLQPAYFDQLHAQLDEEATAAENVSPGTDKITINGKSKHIMGYLQDFLFAPDRARSPVKFLSGGERNRLLLARLFTQPANLLILDEPTNDLDAETLDLLEETLTEYQGTLLIVSHDREFLNNVVTSSLVFEGNGKVKEYVGGYDDWIRQKAAATAPVDVAASSAKSNKPATVAEKNPPGESNPAARKMSFNERRELEQLPAKIEQLEQKLAALHEQMGAPDFYKQDKQKIAAASGQVSAIETELTTAFERWESLEALRK